MTDRLSRVWHPLIRAAFMCGDDGGTLGGSVKGGEPFVGTCEKCGRRWYIESEVSATDLSAGSGDELFYEYRFRMYRQEDKEDT